jgi:hypothetical protein
LLRVDRIDHGNACLADPDLVRELAVRRIALTVCPLSNLGLKVVPSMQEHPLKALMAHGRGHHTICSKLHAKPPPQVFGHPWGHLPICSKPYAKPNRELNQPILAAWRRSAMVSRRLGRRCDERRSTVRLKGRRGAHPPVCDVIGGLPVAVSAREEDPELVRRPQTDPQMRRHSAPFRFLSIFRKESARNCASADELGHGAGDGFGLLPSHRQ